MSLKIEDAGDGQAKAELPDCETWDDLRDTAGQINVAMLSNLVAGGMDVEDATVQVEQMTNVNKWFAAQYLGLYLAGKIPPGKLFKRSKE